MIVPKVGIGPLQFGMSGEDVLELLGTPDEVITRVPQVSITDETSDIDGVKRPPGAELVVLTQLRILTYTGLGISLTFETSQGLGGITCRSLIPITSEVSFPGRASEGNGLGSTSDELISAYGEPDGIGQGLRSSRIGETPHPRLLAHSTGTLLVGSTPEAVICAQIAMGESSNSLESGIGVPRAIDCTA